MRRRSWTRWILKWIGTVTCVLILLLWVGGQWYWIRLSPGRVLDIVVAAGSLGIDIAPTYIAYPQFEVHTLSPASISDRLGFHLPFSEAPPAFWSVTIPLWMCLLLTGLPTAMAWVSREPFDAGCCRDCGYDLTGNVSGRCPECGEAVGAVREGDDAGG